MSITASTSTSTTDRLHALTSRPRGRRFNPPGGRHRSSAASAASAAPAASPAPPRRPPDGPPLLLSPYARAAHPPGEPALPPWLLRTHAELGPEAPRPHTDPPPDRHPSPSHRPGSRARRAAASGRHLAAQALAFTTGLATGLALLATARLLPLLG
ncbi:hypothetical protein J0910_05195 [Nocardiopsis sp. CNT-189]|uniref:hypothetical protein n=1 Tax=Nocardiopsis oceanisediminis TaxID=2816862 RepID=UPI003B2DDCBC